MTLFLDRLHEVRVLPYTLGAVLGMITSFVYVWGVR
jgi:hypothetical protein